MLMPLVLAGAIILGAHTGVVPERSHMKTAPRLQTPTVSSESRFAQINLGQRGLRLPIPPVTPQQKGEPQTANCRPFLQWIAILDKTFPNFDWQKADSPTVFHHVTILFQDEHFTPFFGKTLAAATQRELYDFAITGPNLRPCYRQAAASGGAASSNYVTSYITNVFSVTGAFGRDGVFRRFAALKELDALVKEAEAQRTSGMAGALAVLQTQAKGSALLENPNLVLNVLGLDERAAYKKRFTDIANAQLEPYFKIVMAELNKLPNGTEGAFALTRWWQSNDFPRRYSATFRRIIVAPEVASLESFIAFKANVDGKLSAMLQSGLADYQQLVAVYPNAGKGGMDADQLFSILAADLELNVPELRQYGTLLQAKKVELQKSGAGVAVVAANGSVNVFYVVDPQKVSSQLQLQQRFLDIHPFRQVLTGSVASTHFDWDKDQMVEMALGFDEAMQNRCPAQFDSTVRSGLNWKLDDAIALSRTAMLQTRILAAFANIGTSVVSGTGVAGAGGTQISGSDISTAERNTMDARRRSAEGAINNARATMEILIQMYGGCSGQAVAGAYTNVKLMAKRDRNSW